MKQFFSGIIFIVLLRILIIVFVSVIVIVLSPYSFTTIYNFPSPQPFSGNILYNPYQSLSNNTRFCKANLHAHSHAYSGVTDGHSTDKELFDGYKSMNYDVVGISNYQTINQAFSSDSGYIPLYEHGYNAWKRHHICIGANEVTWWDYILFQSLHQKQDMIFRLKPTIDVLAIAHPKFRNSFNASDFTELTDYDCIEVLNHYRTSSEAWDSALSTGHPVWIVADDDSHNVKADGETGVCWTMIAAPPIRREITKALKHGQCYGVEGKHGINNNGLQLLQTIGLQCFIQCDSIADSVQFIGQGGKIKAVHYRIDTSSYTFDNYDTYIRIKIFRGNSCMWLNPIFRTPHGGIVPIHATENTIATWLWRVASIGSWLGILIVVIRKKTFRRKHLLNSQHLKL